MNLSEKPFTGLFTLIFASYEKARKSLFLGERASTKNASKFFAENFRALTNGTEEELQLQDAVYKVVLGEDYEKVCEERWGFKHEKYDSLDELFFLELQTRPEWGKILARFEQRVKRSVISKKEIF